jgi:hypothetical protein
MVWQVATCCNMLEYIRFGFVSIRRRRMRRCHCTEKILLVTYRMSVVCPASMRASGLTF